MPGCGQFRLMDNHATAALNSRVIDTRAKVFLRTLLLARLVSPDLAIE
jgi:hypothetical protein